MRNLIVVAAFLFVATGAGVLAVQHAQAQHAQPHQVPQHASRPHLAVCGEHHGAASPKQHVAEMATALKLTEPQAAEIETLTTEACAAMAKYHERILAVLTPEQRAAMQSMHGGR